MALPRAFLPLRHRTFRTLWLANLASNTGMWIQNTGAGWLMTSLDPSPIMVSLVQAATMLPVFLFALPAGALADIIDRRLYLIGAQAWVLTMALLLAALTFSGVLGPWGLLAITFGIGAGNALNFPAWAATTPELVPREDLVQAIALNGIGFNLARALGPAFGGFAIAWAGAGFAFALNAFTFLWLIVALVLWRRPAAAASTMPKEHFLSAMRVGVRFVAASPALRATILRAVAFFLFTAAIWALLPLVVRRQLHLGPEAFGLMLTAMGAGAVGIGFALPSVRRLLDTDGIAFWGTLLACAGMGLVAAAGHWFPAAIGMVMFGMAWVTVASTLQAVAQMVSPAWVRARAIGIYQLCFFGALSFGAAIWGWVGDAVGLPLGLGSAAAIGAVVAVAVRPWRLDLTGPAAAPSGARLPEPEAPAPELAGVLSADSGRIIEMITYRVDPADRAAFLRRMAEMRRVRLRNGASVWRLYEDVAHPERWIELWSVESWTEHLREAVRLTEDDRAIVAQAAALHGGAAPPEVARFINVVP
ncbi:MFS transporter [Roseomonas sp. NAR14]|uniref:MFS transporter n=1 Tax=Roseomonas acroporae TaxID=2937791 RepID=A0A9X1Y345_9PROT|nr:MFS transporter [Roseomonas acroporae]MCK8783289.1 MFS transporter [Roseomonas acroporae]